METIFTGKSRPGAVMGRSWRYHGISGAVLPQAQRRHRAGCGRAHRPHAQAVPSHFTLPAGFVSLRGRVAALCPIGTRPGRHGEQKLKKKKRCVRRNADIHGGSAGCANGVCIPGGRPAFAGGTSRPTTICLHKKRQRRGRACLQHRHAGRGRRERRKV